MTVQELKKTRRIRRKAHIRKNTTGTMARPRLTVFKSNMHIYAQIITDVERKTLASASTIDKEVVALLKADMNKKQKSELVGEVLAKRAVEANISQIEFDRNGYPYHGRVKALAEGARKGGLKF
jgi:large subunit ribosomal protein L18